MISGEGEMDASPVLLYNKLSTSGSNTRDSKNRTLQFDHTMQDFFSWFVNIGFDNGNL